MSRTAVIMYHSVGLENHEWVFPWISAPVALFQEHMEALARRGYRSEFFKDVMPRRDQPAASVALTFDDGYLDNWVYVFPILDRLGLRGTVFVNPDFVDPRDVMRVQRQQPSTHSQGEAANEDVAGFLSWRELRAMEASGLFDVQSHALTHTWYPKGPKIVDFWRPGAATRRDGPAWMLWNRFPEAKPHYLTSAATQESKIAYGTPIYEHGKSLATRRFFPDDGVEVALQEYVASHGGAEFFDRDDWRHELHLVAQRNRNTDGRGGVLESERAYLSRVEHELRESKRIIEKQLDKEVSCMCWPGGGVTPAVVEIARSVGYRRFTLPSAWRANQDRGEYEDMCSRMGSCLHRRWRGRMIRPASPREFLWAVRSAGGSRWHGTLYRLALLGRFLQSFIR